MKKKNNEKSVSVYAPDFYSSLKVFKNPKYGCVSGFINNDIVYLNVYDVAHGLGFMYNNGLPKLDEINRLLKKFKYKNVPVESRDYIPENMFYRLAMKADNVAAESFQAYLADEVIPTIRKTGSYSTYTAQVPAPVQTYPTAMIQSARVDERHCFTSTLKLYIGYAKNQGDTRADNEIYAKFSAFTNRLLGLKNGQRPIANDDIQNMCRYIEKIMGEAFMDGMENNKFYAKIEDAVQRKVKDFASCFVPALPLLGN
jgi:prophage antirepressor-like protein